MLGRALLLSGGLLSLIGLLLAGLVAYIASAGARARPAPADAIVVLGAAVWPGGQPSPALASRTRRGVDLWREGLAPWLVLSGGEGWNPPAEAEVMRRLARQWGVPGDRILLDDQAHTTAESAANVAALARQHGWQHVILVSDPFHLPRAAWLFHAQGLRVSTAATDATYYSPATYTWHVLREALALAGLVLLRLGLPVAPLEPRVERALNALRSLW